MSVDLETESAIVYARLTSKHREAEQRLIAARNEYERVIPTDAPPAHKAHVATAFNEAAIKLGLLDEILLGRARRTDQV